MQDIVENELVQITLRKLSFKRQILPMMYSCIKFAGSNFMYLQFLPP